MRSSKARVNNGGRSWGLDTFSDCTLISFACPFFPYIEAAQLRMEQCRLLCRYKFSKCVSMSIMS